MGSDWNWMFYWSRQGLYELEGLSGSVGSMSDCDSSNDFLLHPPSPTHPPTLGVVSLRAQAAGKWCSGEENGVKLSARSICMATWLELKRRQCGEGTAGGGRWWQEQLQRGEQETEASCFCCHWSSSAQIITMFWLGYFTVLFDAIHTMTWSIVVVQKGICILSRTGLWWWPWSFPKNGDVIMTHWWFPAKTDVRPTPWSITDGPSAWWAGCVYTSAYLDICGGVGVTATERFGPRASCQSRFDIGSSSPSSADFLSLPTVHFSWTIGWILLKLS